MDSPPGIKTRSRKKRETKDEKSTNVNKESEQSEEAREKRMEQENEAIIRNIESIYKEEKKNGTI